jgi:hypothetical protein
MSTIDIKEIVNDVLTKNLSLIVGRVVTQRNKMATAILEDHKNAGCEDQGFCCENPCWHLKALMDTHVGH